MPLAKTLRSLTNQSQIILPQYRQWLVQHGDDPYPDWVALRILKVLTTPPRDRSGSYSASTSGRCLRAQELGYLGAPATFPRGVIEPQQQLVYSDGKWRHMRWQADLLSAGLLYDIEVPMPWPRMNAMGTMDGAGIVRDDHPNPMYRGQEFGFELKGVNPYQFPRWIKEKTPQDSHMMQIHRYFLISGHELFVCIYENKWSQDTWEWVVTPDPKYMRRSERELKELNRAAREHKLHEMLPSCKARIGQVWSKDCPYGGNGGTCDKRRKWDE